MHRLLIVCTFLWSALSGTAMADTVTVSDAASFQSAVAAAGPGDEILLAPGDYARMTVSGGAGGPGDPVTIRSADPSDPARLLGLSLRDASHVAFADLVFDYRYVENDPYFLRPFEINGSQDVSVRDSLFDGDIARGGESSGRGFPTAFGLGIRWSDGITIEGNEIRNFLRGLIASESSNLRVRGNDMHTIRSDGMNFAQVRHVTIEDNWIHDFKRSTESKDHADMIQFWTNRTSEPSVDITIANNVLSSGQGLYTQSIFMRNDQVDRGISGDEMYYRDVTIEGNVISNAHLHGITVGETNGLTIANNTVLRNARSEGEGGSTGLWTPQIRISTDARNVSILRNAAPRFEGFSGQKDWILQDNVVVQDNSRLQPGHYFSVFEGDIADPASLSYRAGGILDGTGIGAQRLAR